MIHYEVVGGWLMDGMYLQRSYFYCGRVRLGGDAFQHAITDSVPIGSVWFDLLLGCSKIHGDLVGVEGSLVTLLVLVSVDSLK